MENDPNDVRKSSSYEIIKIDKRLDNIEKAITTIESVASDAIEKWSENRKQQIDLEKSIVESNNLQHNRTIKLISLVIAIIFTFCVIALYMNQY